MQYSQEQTFVYTPKSKAQDLSESKVCLLHKYSQPCPCDHLY